MEINFQSFLNLLFSPKCLHRLSQCVFLHFVGGIKFIHLFNRYTRSFSTIALVMNAKWNALQGPSKP
jgi:hypothetical protein